MKGVVFTEFLDMVEEKFSEDVVDAIIDASELSTGGAYTAVGTYSHTEILQLVTHLSKETKVDVPVLVETFGHYLFQQFTKSYPMFFADVDNSFDFLQTVENHIHVEVKKLYPDAELPTFETTMLDENTLELIYISKRPFANLAEGMIKECALYYKETVEIEVEDNSTDDGMNVRFLIKKI